MPRRLPDRVAAAVEGLAPLDAVGAPLARAVRALLPPGRRKDLLSGTWLGHPLHPLLTDIPVGAWSAAAVLDLVGSPAADRAVDVGLAAVPATALAGWSDWSDLQGPARRVGLVHAAANTLATALYLSSRRARRRGDRTRGVALGLLGFAAAGAGGFLGGHLVYRLGIGVDHTMDDDGPEGWTDVAAADDLLPGRPVVVRAGDVDVLLHRHAGGVDALANRCTHLSGPLAEGTIADGCVTCPWHQSTFRLDDGTVVHGPATAPQPRFDVQELHGRVLVRRHPAPGDR